MPYALARPLLFLLDPETAHLATLGGAELLRTCGVLALLSPRVPPQQVHAMGLQFPNPVGLAAGLDKDAAHIDALAALGFGFVEVGTVTPRPQPGNPRPRLFRLPRANALINRFGFNNTGLAAFRANLSRARFRGILGVNIGKNFDTPIERAADDYCLCLEGVYGHASYVTINVSSPNTVGLRALQDRSQLDALLGRVVATRERLARVTGRRVPLALKVAPDLVDAQIREIANAVRRHGLEAVIATNTSVSREGVEGLPHALEAGGLSGAPIARRATRVLAAFAGELGSAATLIGAGGIHCGADAADKIRAGAQLVQLYTGLVYRGPGLIAECVRAIAAAAKPAPA